jgi:hypothetical protein
MVLFRVSPMARKRRRATGGIDGERRAHSASPASNPPSAPPSPFTATRVAAAVALCLGVALWRSAPPPERREDSSTDATAPRVPGVMELTPRELPQPSYNENDTQCGIAQSTWTFGGKTADDVRALIQGAGFDEATRSALAAHMTCDATGCVVDAPDALLRALPAAPRGRMYRALGAFQGQMFAALPHRRPIAFGPWSTLARTPAVRDALAQLAWTEPDGTYLADVATACRAMPDVAARVELLSILRRRYGLDVRVRPPADADPAAVARYWTLGDASPPAERVARVRAAQAAGASIPLAELLSGWPARRLNTYEDDHEGDRDCYWSTLHFAADDAERFPVPTPEAFSAELAARWREVSPRDARYGDAVVLQGPNGPLHAAIWLAEGSVFSKDGRARSRPWTVARLDDVRRDYPQLTAVRYHRAR